MPSVETAASKTYPALSRAAKPKPTVAPSTSPARIPRGRTCRRSTNISAPSFTASSISPTPTNIRREGWSRWYSIAEAPRTPSVPPVRKQPRITLTPRS